MFHTQHLTISQVALFKGVLIFLAAVAVTAQIVYKLYVPSLPLFEVMGTFSLLVLHLVEIQPSDIVVLELSSFQLEELRNTQTSPRISIVTNISPNHLDRYPGMNEYIQAKKGIIAHQKPSDYTILNYNDPELRRWEQECKGSILWYSTKNTVSDGAFIDGDLLSCR